MNLRASHYSGFNADNEAVTSGRLGVFGRLEGGPQGNTRLPRKGRGLATITPDLAVALWRSPRCPLKELPKKDLVLGRGSLDHGRRNGNLPISTVKQARAGKMADPIARQIVEIEQYWAALFAAKVQTDVSSRGVLGIAGDGECCASVFRGSGRMPAYQSIPEFDLSEKYHLKAVRCERCAKNASDQTTEQEWQQLAAQWHSMANQAAKLQGDNSFESL
jgi:hypothetical protein